MDEDVALVTFLGTSTKPHILKVNDLLLFGRCHLLRKFVKCFFLGALALVHKFAVDQVCADPVEIWTLLGLSLGGSTTCVPRHFWIKVLATLMHHLLCSNVGRLLGIDEHLVT